MQSADWLERKLAVGSSAPLQNLGQCQLRLTTARHAPMLVMQGKGLADKGKFTEAEVAAMENVE